MSKPEQQNRDRIASDIATAEATVPSEWKVGDIVLDTYQVMQVHEGGGMGLVYRVHHRGWDVDLAVKSPRLKYFQTEQQKRNFVRECETWIDLGLYPHIASCFYVRTLGGIPRVFAEYVEGGSLNDWIRLSKLYEGGSQKALERIIDIAIQMAWGLHYAHERGMVHQDVKPANVLMAPDGTAKVSDFGLARAWAAAGETIQAQSPGMSMVVQGSGGMTPAYASPEQFKGMTLNRRTDIWSWAVLVYEMFMGELTWGSGLVVPGLLGAYIEDGADEGPIPRMPKALAELLQQCLRINPDERPHDFEQIADRLKNIYQSIGSKAYSRAKPEPLKLLADALNNRGVSMLDLGRENEAVRFFDEALKSDPHHPEATYNRGLVLWRAAKITDDILIRQLEEVRKTHGQNWRANYVLGLIHAERGAIETARSFFVDASKSGKQFEVQKALSRIDKFISCSARCVKSFEGHIGGVRSVCLSSDDLWALSGGEDNILRLWEVATGRCVQKYQGHLRWVKSVYLSADNRWALSGSLDDTLRIWTVDPNHCMRIIVGHTKSINSVILSKDGRWALSGSDDETLRQWEVATGRCTMIFKGHKGGVTSVCLSSDERWALSGSDDKTLRLWEVATGRCVQKYEGHIDGVTSVCMSTNGRWALSGSGDNTLRLWDINSARCLRIFKGHIGVVYSVSLSADGLWAVSGGDALRLWDVSTGRCVRTFDGHTDLVVSVSLSSDGCLALSGGADPSSDGNTISKTLYLWDISILVKNHMRLKAPWRLSAVKSLEESNESACCFENLLTEARCAFKSGQYAQAHQALSQARAIPGYERNSHALQMWKGLIRGCSQSKLRAAWCNQEYVGHVGTVNSVCLNDNCLLALSGSDDYTLRLWDVSTGRCVRIFEGHTAEIYSVSLSADGRFALSGSSDKTFRLWEVTTGQCVQIFEKHIADVHSVSFSPDGRWVLSGSGKYKDADQIIRLYEATSGRFVRMFKGHTNWVCSINMSRDGNWILSGSSDKTLKLWKTATGQCVQTFVGHTAGVYSVNLSTDGRWALSGSGDQTLRLWEVSTGLCIRTFEGHTDIITAVCLSIDGRWALSGSEDKTLKLWELATGQCVRTFEGHAGSINSIGLSKDGHWALSGGWEGSLRRWELDWDYEVHEPENWNEGARSHLVHFLTMHTPYAAEMPRDRKPSEQEIFNALTRKGRPAWSNEDFKNLLETLACANYGWLRPEGVKRELEKMAQGWNAPPALS